MYISGIPRRLAHPTALYDSEGVYVLLSDATCCTIIMAFWMHWAKVVDAPLNTLGMLVLVFLAQAASFASDEVGRIFVHAWLDRAPTPLKMSAQT